MEAGKCLRRRRRSWWHGGRSSRTRRSSRRGCGSGSTKLRDVRRDPRIAVHSPTLEPPEGDPSAWPGDAKLAGTVVETGTVAGASGGAGASFKIDITEVTLTYVGSPADHIVIESWHPGRGLQRRTRR